MPGILLSLGYGPFSISGRWWLKRCHPDTGAAGWGQQVTSMWWPCGPWGQPWGDHKSDVGASAGRAGVESIVLKWFWGELSVLVTVTGREWDAPLGRLSGSPAKTSGPVSETRGGWERGAPLPGGSWRGVVAVVLSPTSSSRPLGDGGCENWLLDRWTGRCKLGPLRGDRTGAGAPRRWVGASGAGLYSCLPGSGCNLHYRLCAPGSGPDSRSHSLSRGVVGSVGPVSSLDSMWLAFDEGGFRPYLFFWP